MAHGYLELEQGSLFAIKGHYEDLLLAREKRLEARKEAHHKLAQYIEREEDWMRYGVTARRKRNQRRVARLQALKEEFKQTSSKEATKIQIKSNTKSGSKIICTQARNNAILPNPNPPTKVREYCHIFFINDFSSCRIFAIIFDQAMISILNGTKRKGRISSFTIGFSFLQGIL